MTRAPGEPKGYTWNGCVTPFVMHIIKVKLTKGTGVLGSSS